LTDQKFWLGFSLLRNIGPRRILPLYHHFGDLERAWHASQSELVAAGLSQRIASSIVEQRPTIDLNHEMARVQRVKASLRTLGDSDYPSLLREIDDPPPVLYIRGTLTEADSLAITIVGTRKATVYGRDVAYNLAHDLAAAGVTVISGLAHGADSAAHEGALKAGGRTIAVSGCGISEIYPPDNLPLAHRIIEQGAVITEFPIGTPPTGSNFPRRNRIMSGLSYGVVVVEAGEKSGALITAGLAGEQGRDVFAVPSNILNQSGRGTNQLIQDGAKLVRDASDILEEINTSHQHTQMRTQTQAAVPGNEQENAIIALLSNDPIHVDEIARRSNIPVATVTSTLTILELKGLARTTGPMQYILSR